MHSSKQAIYKQLKALNQNRLSSIKSVTSATVAKTMTQPASQRSTAQNVKVHARIAGIA